MPEALFERRHQINHDERAQALLVAILKIGRVVLAD